MNHIDFADIVNNRLGHCKKVLTVKGEEYSREGDRLWNFKVAARIDNQTPGEALWGRYKKHLVSLMDMITMHSNGEFIPQALIDEKMSDSINYHLLLEGIFIDGNNKLTEAYAVWVELMKHAPNVYGDLNPIECEL